MATVPGQVFDFSVTDSSLIGMLQKINSFTDVGQGGMFGIFILMIVGGALFFMTRGVSGNERAFSVSMFVTMIIAILLKILSLIGDAVFWVCVVLCLVGVIFLIKEQGQYE